MTEQFIKSKAAIAWPPSQLLGFLIRNYFLICEKALKHIYLYNPFQMLSKSNVFRLNCVYERSYRKSARPERFFPKINNLIVRTGRRK